MVNPQLLAYVREQSSAGFSEVEIIEKAQKAGWSDTDITAAIEANQSNAPWAAGAAAGGASASSYRASTYSGTERSNAKGMVGLVIRLGLAKDEQRANLILIAFIMVVSGIAAYLVWPKNAVTPVPPGTIVVPGVHAPTK